MCGAVLSSTLGEEVVKISFPTAEAWGESHVT
jgi:hypothetical protein